MKKRNIFNNFNQQRLVFYEKKKQILVSTERKYCFKLSLSEHTYTPIRSKNNIINLVFT